MAQKVIVELIDDLDGEPIDFGGETISFAVNGVEYTIDLNDKNATEFHRKLDYYIRHAERVGGRQQPTRVAKTSAAPSSQVIREWAAGNGYPVSTRGRIAADVVEAYAAAH
ncbi:histone-like nucleoid-structuring protein Lsr2 [Prescottella subtropica]|uniref:histone-like nucleoid-structuring protein Lsr2 n=1 Tax=Prescottella subtropica TaxID=2545757 RepID=UPI0010F5EE42|nr:Lsr2 family protein [Prescottella subtropica]